MFLLQINLVLEHLQMALAPNPSPAWYLTTQSTPLASSPEFSAGRFPLAEELTFAVRADLALAPALAHWSWSYGPIDVTRFKLSAMFVTLDGARMKMCSRVNLGGWKATEGLWQLLSHAPHWGWDSLGAKLREMGCNDVWDGLFNIRAVYHSKPLLSFSSSTNS